MQCVGRGVYGSAMTATQGPSDTPAQAAHRARYTLTMHHAGDDLRGAVKVHWKSAAFTTWDEAIAELAAGITVTVPCSTPRADGSGRHTHHKHKVRFHPDGSVALLDHPCYEQNPEAELMLAALGGHLCTCLAVAVHVPARQLVSAHVHNHNAVNVRLRALHTAVAWAQRADTVWTPAFGDAYLRYGITPETLAAWEAEGWDADAARRFQQTFTPIALANQWRAAGDLTLRAATLAGRGESPNAEAQWASVGFTPARSARWRKGGFSPTDAYEWDRHNITPTVAARFARDLSATTTPSLDTVKDWCAQGIPCTTVLAWHRVTGGVFSVAHQWRAAGLTPNDYTRIAAWNHTSPHRAISSEQAGAYRKRFFPTQDPAVLAEAIEAGFSAEQWSAATDRLIKGAHSRLLDALSAYDRDRVQNGQYRWGWGDPDQREWALRGLRSHYVLPEVARFIVRFEVREATLRR